MIFGKSKRELSTVRMQMDELKKVLEQKERLIIEQEKEIDRYKRMVEDLKSLKSLEEVKAAADKSSDRLNQMLRIINHDATEYLRSAKGSGMALLMDLKDSENYKLIKYRIEKIFSEIDNASQVIENIQVAKQRFIDGKKVTLT